MEQEKLLILAWQIVDRLENAGFEAYLVGGYVRDRLLGRPIKDIDIATSALPDNVMSLFERAKPTGLEHGTVTIIVQGVPFEVTTFRSESGYSDHRRPDDVRFIDDLREDLSRRDFTMNAMALNRSSVLIDPFGGERDLRSGVLRCVGEPEKRFAEDALRMLRCIRFACEYDLAIERETWHALRRQAATICHVAIERIRVELERIVEGNCPEKGFRLLMESGLHQSFKVPLMLDFRLPADWNKTDDPIIRWSMLMLSTNMNLLDVSGLLHKFTFPSRKLRKIVSLLLFHRELLSAANRHSSEQTWKLLALKHGKAAAERWLAMISLQQAEELQLVDYLRCGREWLEEMTIEHASMLAITGDDLITAGFKPGPELGAILRGLLELAAIGTIRNDKELLLAEAKNLRVEKSEPDE